MKKILPILLVGILVISGLGASGLTINTNNLNSEIEKNKNLDRGTHTVLAELGTATDCPYCPSHEYYLYKVQGDFEIVTLACSHYVWSAGYNQAIKTRLQELGISGYPTSFWDGGYKSVVGGQSSVNALQAAYNSCASRTVADVDLELSIFWLGNAKIQIDVNVINNEDSDYDGHIHVYILELTSRWKTYDGGYYKDALLDCPINVNINVESGGTWSDSIIWDGNNYGYGDITEDNIKGVAAVFSQSTKYTDEVIGVLPIGNQPPNKPIVSGPTHSDTNVDNQFTSTTTDDEGEDVYYWIDWGDGTNNSWFGPYASGSNAIENHIYGSVGIYDIKVKAKDINDLESSWSEIHKIYIGNFGPSEPEISGPANGKIKTEIEFTFVATDPNDDNLYYTIRWGDGSIEDWFGPSNSGQEVKMSHSWSKEGNWVVEAKVKDIAGLESDWARLDISIPRTKQSFDLLFTHILERFPALNRLIENLISY
jgi:hypothetical protein